MKKLVIFIFAMSSFFGCNDDILDAPPQDRISEDAVWSDENLIRAYHNGLYNAILHGFNIHMQSKATDEAYCAINWDIGNIPQGTLTPDNVTSIADTHWTGGGGLYYWNTGFQDIRKINIFLEKMEGDEIMFDDKARLVAEAKFLRAYIYFLLMERFGEVPIVTQSYEMGEEVGFARNTIEECVDFIDAQLSEAVPDLPEKYASSDANFGRATQDASQALRSRLFLYAASPLYNPTNDQEKWQKAADAAEALLNSGYELHPDYTTLFNQPSGSANSELIFVRNFSVSNSHQAPMHNLNRRYGAYGGWWASNGPSQNLVDDYDMINGEPAFIYPGGVKTINPASGYDPNNPYANRDPRFDATIIHDESTYHGDFFEMWVSNDGNTWGFDSYKQSGDNPRSNYVLRKFMPDEGVPLNWQQPYTNPWVIFRLGEIYLNYAEAKFELGDEATCREYLSRVRARVGMPPISDEVTGEELRQRLYNERRVELAFEEHRFWDVRRWEIAMDVENRPIMGMDVILNTETGEKTYTPVQLLERQFEEKMYFLPIEANEILRNSGMEQNPGY
ncbi:RagB/SusD family nutrient uptake outer membrane protein [Catalinimonas niigatensis]|uniref:RagB/SusD family nutrient uptake outer membrane protein n=1 Tax=Catalinimonas niigatensis TaxID=1397264 RepID=UPI002666C811|nr:RagB/SusD family nutrient uptake outer membrane protein [Catalinimonas niigatensis]WPP48795.1 RagB/SusD family nutrient uptake outer membrane protein [Catalinimonas niigatensis]